MKYLLIILLFPLFVQGQIFTQYYSAVSPCGGVTTITYLSQVYDIVEIGNQCWMAENLNVGTLIPGTTIQTSNGIIEKHCYDDLESNCTIYGGLYKYNEAINYDNVYNQGICPKGWHIPSTSEVNTLSSFLGGESVAGGKMKETGTTHWLTPNTGATNESGFTALAGGLMLASELRGFFLIGNSSYMWKNGLKVGGYPESFDMIYNLTRLFPENSKDHYDAVSIRCLKD